MHQQELRSVAKVICAISGLELKIPHIAMTLDNRELAHPIFYLPQKKLLGMYERYLKQEWNDIDSYLLYLALLHSTDHVKFCVPVTYRAQHTQKIIANTIDKLVNVMWRSSAITHPSFKQPKYIITDTIATNSLSGISDFLDTWNHNIELFHMGYAREKHIARLVAAEDKLSKVILSGTTGTHLAVQVANWAAKAAEFPEAKAEEWKKTIRKCYNSSAMFSTPKKTLEEIKEYCEGNIEVGTIHFHSLMVVLKEGIRRHTDFLGLGDMNSIVAASNAPKPSTYELLDSSAADVGNNAIIDIIAAAPTEVPVRADYPSQLAFVRAKLNYRVYLQYKKVEAAVEEDVTSTPVTSEENINV